MKRFFLFFMVFGLVFTIANHGSAENGSGELSLAKTNNSPGRHCGVSCVNGIDTIFSGKVGIGSDAPEEQLKVVSIEAPIATFGNSGDDWVTLNFERLGEILASIGLVQSEGLGDIPGNSFVVGLYDGENWSDPLIIESAAPTASIYVDTSGSVGIGTSAPQGALDVNGPIYQRGDELYADYVFDKDYKLESIEEHTDFMNKKKHLKAVPGAITDRNGQEVIEYGAYMKGMLEELEKAHVYISQLNERLKEYRNLAKTQEEAIKRLTEKVEAINMGR